MIITKYKIETIDKDKSLKKGPVINKNGIAEIKMIGKLRKKKFL